MDVVSKNNNLLQEFIDVVDTDELIVEACKAFLHEKNQFSRLRDPHDIYDDLIQRNGIKLNIQGCIIAGCSKKKDNIYKIKKIDNGIDNYSNHHACGGTLCAHRNNTMSKGTFYGECNKCKAVACIYCIIVNSNIELNGMCIFISF